MANACATCARTYGNLSDPLSEKPLLPERGLYCCGKSICSQCLSQNKRWETYCPYCQITSGPSVLPQGLKDPPAYSTLIEHVPRPITSDNEQDDPPAYSAGQQRQAIDEKHSEEEPAPDVLHFLTPNDSIHGLSLAYGVPANALRKANNVYSDHLLQGRRTLLIPGEYYKGGVSLSPRPIEGEEEEMKKQKVRRWMVACKVAEYDVALLYLQQAEWSLDVAIDAYEDDERWEKEHPLEAKKRVKNGKKAKDVGMRRFVGGGR